MKFLKFIPWVVIAAVAACLTLYISDHADGYGTDGVGWGIAKDNPLKR